LVLVLLGFSGAWIENLAALEPYRPLFLGVASVALAIAGLRIFRPARACAADGACWTPQTRRTHKILFSVVAALALIALVFPYFARIFY
jgi:mercuric ion transport protein